MRWCKGLVIMAVFAMMFPLAGCCGGKTTVVEQPAASSTPLGEELIKLKEAHEKGAISDKEFEAAKKKLLKSKK